MDLMWLGLKAIAIGIIATVVMDMWSVFQSKVLKIPSLNYALVGRWFLSLPSGKWQHNTILQTPTLKGERMLGWLLHYAIGGVFAAIYILGVGVQAQLELALLFGMVTLVFPFFFLQPCLGFGVAASKVPHPSRARLMSLCTHLSYGFGLYLAMRLI